MENPFPAKDKLMEGLPEAIFTVLKLQPGTLIACIAQRKRLQTLSRDVILHTWIPKINTTEFNFLMTAKDCCDRR